MSRHARYARYRDRYRWYIEEAAWERRSGELGTAPPERVITHGASGVGSVSIRRPRNHTRHPVLDRVVLVVLVIVDLLVASLTTYLGNLFLIVVANVLLILGLRWLWRQYRHQTSPAEGKPAVGPRKPHIPLLVRLFLLPGMGHLVGDTAVRKARAIRFMRKDQWERGIPARLEPGRGPTRMMLAIAPRTPWEVSMHNWARRHPSECSTTVHLFEPAGHWCRCGSYHYRQLPLA